MSPLSLQTPVSFSPSREFIFNSRLGWVIEIIQPSIWNPFADRNVPAARAVLTLKFLLTVVAGMRLKPEQESVMTSVDLHVSLCPTVIKIIPWYVFLFLKSYVYMRVGLSTCTQVPSVVRVMGSNWNFSYMRFRATCHGCWDSDSGLMEKQTAFLTTEPYSQPQICISEARWSRMGGGSTMSPPDAQLIIS